MCQSQNITCSKNILIVSGSFAMLQKCSRSTWSHGSRVPENEVVCSTFDGSHWHTSKEQTVSAFLCPPTWDKMTGKPQTWSCILYSMFHIVHSNSSSVQQFIWQKKESVLLSGFPISCRYTLACLRQFACPNNLTINNPFPMARRTANNQVTQRPL